MYRLNANDAVLTTVGLSVQLLLSRKARLCTSCHLARARGPPTLSVESHSALWSTSRRGRCVQMTDPVNRLVAVRLWSALPVHCVWWNQGSLCSGAVELFVRKPGSFGA